MEGHGRALGGPWEGLGRPRGVYEGPWEGLGGIFGGLRNDVKIRFSIRAS